ncbi:acyl-CoA dehydrogenase family protein [Facilibium subflavum]|uniref:hypothetical protein n=1 Tax=Facilibium subflavum TaxID=2219058 RepID=UPI000E64965E|nr:hypothetical protein [Facilibium subflavum]
MNNKTLDTQPSWHDEVNAIIASYSLDRITEIPADETLSLLKKSPLLRILDETQFTSPGKLADVVAVCRELGKTDASLGWLVGVANSAWSMKANFTLPESACADMDKNSILSMVLGRPGTLRPSPKGEGLILNGEWQYASGYLWSSYFFGLAMLEDGNVHVVAVPSRDLQIVGPWKSTGLIGTQSVMIRANNVQVSKSFTTSYHPIISGSCKRSYSGYFTGVLMNCLVGTVLGATERAIEYVVENAKKPITGSTYASMEQSGPIRYEIGRLSSKFDLLVRAAEYNADTVDSAVHNSVEPLTSRQRVEIRARAAQIMRGCTEITQSLLWIYGSCGLDKSCPLEKIWRDVHVGALHGGFSKLIPEEMACITLLDSDPATISRMF